MTKKAQITLLSKTLDEIVCFSNDYDDSTLNKEKEEIVRLINKIKTSAFSSKKYLQVVKNIAIETRRTIALKKELFGSKIGYAS